MKVVDGVNTVKSENGARGERLIPPMTYAAEFLREFAVYDEFCGQM